ncbi:MAG: hypothetical protein IPG93_24700 [Burkholderiales bacterium]|nr:hypothetical protein [Burkholderiales bacterium]
MPLFGLDRGGVRRVTEARPPANASHAVEAHRDALAGVEEGRLDELGRRAPVVLNVDSAGCFAGCETALEGSFASMMSD